MTRDERKLLLLVAKAVTHHEFVDLDEVRRLIATIEDRRAMIEAQQATVAGGA